MLVRRTGQDDARTRRSLRWSRRPAASAQPAPTASSAYPLLPSPMISLAYVLIAHRRDRGRVRAGPGASASRGGGARCSVRRRCSARAWSSWPAAATCTRPRIATACRWTSSTSATRCRRTSIAGAGQGRLHHVLRDVPRRDGSRRWAERAAAGAAAGRPARAHGARRPHRRRAVLLGELRLPELGDARLERKRPDRRADAGARSTTRARSSATRADREALRQPRSRSSAWSSSRSRRRRTRSC